MDRAIKVRWLWGVLAGAMISIPFLAVRFAPITDLPQQVAQIRLATEMMAGSGAPYALNWVGPNRVSYGLLAAGWRLLDPLAVGRIVMLAIGLLWLGAVHALAARRQRSIGAALLASILFFNHIVYWGFYSFALGFPAFLACMLLLSSERRGPKQAVLVGIGGFVLFACHALWFGAGLAWFGLRALLLRPRARVIAWPAIALGPVVLLAAIWYPLLGKGGLQTPTEWGTLPWARLSPVWIIDAALGGIRGPLEVGVIILLAAWIGLGLRQRGNTADRELLWAGAMLAAAALLLPHRFANTLQLGARWVPAALTLVLLGAPAPRLPRWLPAAFLALFCLLAAGRWVEIERRELSGLEETLEALPPAPRILGLDYAIQSPRLKVTRPYLQLFAYGQVVQGGELNFSFADFATSLVVYDPPRRKAWTPNLEWHPHLVRQGDFRYFTHAIIGGDEGIHRRFAEHPGIDPATNTGRWRLYALTHTSP